MMNVLWRGTFGDYVMQMWNPMVGGKEVLGTSGLYALRRYAVSYVRPTGPLPVLRVDEQPYGMLPLVGKRFADPGDSQVETAIGKVLGVLRPMWELASNSVPLLEDGDLDKAKDILQTGAWSQTAYYRDKDAKAMCMMPTPFSDAQSSGRNPLIQSVISALGPFNYWETHIGVCNDFLPDPPYSPGYLAGVPWVLADDKDPTKEAARRHELRGLQQLSPRHRPSRDPDAGSGQAVLDASQAGPALLQALAAYSVQKEQGDAVDRFVDVSGAVSRVVSRATSTMPYVEAVAENEGDVHRADAEGTGERVHPGRHRARDAWRARRQYAQRAVAAARQERGLARVRRALRAR